MQANNKPATDGVNREKFFNCNDDTVWFRGDCYATVHGINVGATQ